MATYTKSSPWSSTPETALYLDILRIRPVPSEDSDYKYVIENQYKFRPDLLAYDLYENEKLWWVFAQRNMSILKDPIFDFIPGTQIYLPKKTNLEKYLGV